MKFTEIYKKFIKWLEHPLFAIFFVYIALLPVTYFSLSVWQFIFTAVLVYILTDIAKGLFIRGGKGLVKVPLQGEEKEHASPEGHCFSALFLYVAAGTTIIGAITEFLIKPIALIEPPFYFPAMLNVIPVILVYIDLRMSYYN